MATHMLPCPHCGKELLVGDRAISMNCRHCNRRVSFEAHVIKSYHATANIHTGGPVQITKTGRFHGRVQAKNLHVQGQLYGNVTAQQEVTIESGAKVLGNVTAQKLNVQDGAKLKGFYRIQPSDAPEPPA